MSAPSLKYQQAKYLDFGFLAAKAERAIRSIEENRPVTDEESAALKSGSEFLKQVAAGAEALTSGNYQVQNLKSALEAFEFAIDPLAQLGEALSRPDIAKALNEAAETVTSKVNHGHPFQLSDKERQQARTYRVFFEYFYSFVRTHRASKRTQTVLGHRSGGRVEKLKFA